MTRRPRVVAFAVVAVLLLGVTVAPELSDWLHG